MFETTLAGSLPTGTQFYTDPNSQAARWVAANPNDSRHPREPHLTSIRPGGRASCPIDNPKQIIT